MKTWTANELLTAADLNANFSEVSSAFSALSTASLDDYEEGTYTPAIATGGAAVLSASSGKYTKIGNKVSGTIEATLGSSSADYNTVTLTLPFAAAASNAGGAFVYYADTTQADFLSGIVNNGANTVSIRCLNSGAWRYLEYTGRTPQWGIGKILKLKFEYFTS